MDIIIAIITGIISIIAAVAVATVKARADRVKTAGDRLDKFIDMATSGDERKEKVARAAITALAEDADAGTAKLARITLTALDA